MPVRIIRRAAKVVEVPPPAPEVVERRADTLVPPVAVETHPRGWKVGEAILLKKQDLTEEKGYTKFLLHRIRDGVWYRILSVLEEERRIRLVSQVDYRLEARIDHTMEPNYVIGLFPEGTKEPTEDVLSFVNRQLPRLQISAQETPA